MLVCSDLIFFVRVKERESECQERARERETDGNWFGGGFVFVNDAWDGNSGCFFCPFPV